jgi:hypothetical protein
LTNGISTFKSKIHQKNFNGFAQNCMPSLHQCKLFMSFSGSHQVLDGLSICPFTKGIVQLTPALVGDEPLGNAKRCNPVALQGCDVFIGFLSVDQDCNLKTCALIHNGQNWELVLGALDPHDIGLDALVGCSEKSLWWRLVQLDWASYI